MGYYDGFVAESQVYSQNAECRMQITECICDWCLFCSPITGSLHPVIRILHSVSFCDIINPTNQRAMFNAHKHRGFTLVEIIVALAVFLLFMSGIYSGIQFVFKSVYYSRMKILETGILNEQLEIIRNLPFEDVGIINGSPSGVLERTVTTTRSGIEFEITRTIRNIDDEFDGTIGGDPNDLAPADYKLVEVEIICEKCNQTKKISEVTYVAPKLLEGDPTHGALFIEVFDADGDPVPGADVHVVATETDPTIDLADTTDNDGMLKLVDLGAGIGVYNITVSKTGYTTDQTIAPSEAIPDPVKEPASVEAQNVTEISFSIDKISQIDLLTTNILCSAVGNVSLHVLGAKLFGVEPDVFKVDDDFSTNAGGTHSLTGMEWDSYGLSINSGYDLIGSIPILPIDLPAGVTQPVQLLVGANTSNSLLVNVVDNTTNQPISNASVRVYAGSYDEIKTTGVGFTRQTDWSGGSGQLSYIDETEYWSDDGKVDVNGNNAGDIVLAKVGQNYLMSGELESSVFDLGTTVNFVNLIWDPLGQPVETGADSVRWQIATSDVAGPASWDYLGPDGTSATYYDAENISINSVHNGDRYFRYKIFLQTEDVDFTPNVAEIAFTFNSSCVPSGQVIFQGLSSGDYTVTVTKSGYQVFNDTVSVSQSWQQKEIILNP